MDCFDRDDEARRLWQLFRKGRDVLMLAPRRMGKTVLIERLELEAAREGMRAIVFDVEGYRLEKDFFRVMCASIQEEMTRGQALMAAFTERLRRTIQGAENLGGDWRNLLLDVEWDVFADHLLGHLEESGDGKPWLFLVDEITIFTKALVDGPGGADSASDFLYKLRLLCRKHRKIRWLFTGSIGLDTIARRHGFEGALVDLEIFELQPFERETAGRFLTHIVERNDRALTGGAIERICTRLGWLSPYYLERVAERACELSSGGAVDETLADCAADSLLDLAHRTYWATWREHLDKNFPEPERTHLFTILDEISRTPEGASVDTLRLALSAGAEPPDDRRFVGYLDSLEADGYLIAEPGRIRFRFLMGLLREWWQRYVAQPTTGGSAHG